MVTNDNDEIKQKASEKEWDYSASFKDKADDYENYLMNEARADTAKQIFKELGNDNYLMNEARADTANQIFADLEKNDTGYGDIVLAKEELQALKKKYKVD